jgi:hypothetical protein
MKTVFQQWLSAEFGVAEAQRLLGQGFRVYHAGRSARPPEVATLIQAHVTRHEARALLARVLQGQSARAK